jgi:ATP-binding cassette subfamily G (WHITE) protein 1/ATP-binding cassette subfamily G (WHITE) protein 2
VTEKTEKVILQDVSGFVPAGSLIGILGPSGAGKTTFLNVLSRKLRSKKITGEITVNQQHASRRQFQHLSGFVAQDDVLLGSLTCEEALLFAARLKLPDSVPEAQQVATARALLKNLGLWHVKDHLIGYTGAASRNTGIQRGLSGGERKRVSVCFEMVSNPKILFLDEPTSGLDSFAAKAVMENLRDLAFYGRTIVATIHQPSAEIFRMFDYLLLLAEGQTVYFGPAHKAIKHFTSLGISPPPNVNPADFLLKTIHVPPKDLLKVAEEQSEAESLMLSRSREIARKKGEDLEMEDLEAHRHVTGLRAASHEQVEKLIDGYKSSKHAASVNEHLGLKPSSSSSSGKKSKRDLAHAGGDDGEDLPSGSSKHRKTEKLSVEVPHGYTASRFKQFRLLFARGTVNLFREPALLKARLFQAIAISLMAGLIWLRLDKSQAGAADRYSSIFFVLTSAVFGALNGPTFVFPSERGVYFREKSSNMYSSLIYYLSKFLVELPSNIIFPFISTTIVYFMIGFNDHPIPWLVMCGFSMLLNMVGHAVGMFLTCVILDTGLVIKIQPLIVLPLMIFSGFFVNADSVKNYFVWLEAISFLKYAFRACCNAVFSLGDKLVFKCPANTVCRFRDGHDVLVSLNLIGHPIWKDAVILLGIGLGFHLVAYIALYIHTRRL